MTKLPGAKPSPRIAGGVLRWYAGDTFSVTLALELRDPVSYTHLTLPTICSV